MTLFRWIFPALLSALLIMGCQPTVDSGEGNLSGSSDPKPTKKVDSTPSSDPEGSGSANSGTVTSTATKAPETKKPAGPPNWKDRYTHLVSEVKKRWELPPSDKKVDITMSNGATRQGYVLGVANDRATFNVLLPGNPEPQRVTIERSKLKDKTRIMLWVDDAAKFHATMRVKKEKAEYEKEHRALASSIPDANKPNQTSTTIEGNNRPPIAPGTITPVSRGVVVNDDGSVDTIVAWLRSNIGNPRSIKIHRWGKLVRDPRPSVKGYNMDVTFSSNSGGSLGTIRETKRFFFNREGKITNTANVRQ